MCVHANPVKHQRIVESWATTRKQEVVSAVWQYFTLRKARKLQYPAPAKKKKPLEEDLNLMKSGTFLSSLLKINELKEIKSASLTDEVSCLADTAGVGTSHL